MNVIKEKPYFLFIGLIVNLLSFGFYKRMETIDINIHDTYYVMSWIDAMIFISFIYGILALIYFTLLKLKFKLVNWMTISHVLISIIGLFLVFILSKIVRETSPGDLMKLMKDIDFNEKITIGIWITVFAIIGIQTLFFMNAIYALVKGKQ